MMNIKPDKPSQIVWLETKMTSPEITEKGEEIEIEKIIWYRQYIPDWIDSDFWLNPTINIWWQSQKYLKYGIDWMIERQCIGTILPTDPLPKYIYDWGRPCSHHAQTYKVTHWQDTNPHKRKKEIDPYEQFNKDYAVSCAPSGLRQGSAPRDKYGLL